ncbi:tetratricopeptide repeat protein [uncultured Aquimarina sp.]|uniref:tetratricopeptide repeat protein n=1 Tax=uncultured Aquimarina sp. TaxID=575652 RepID=UPI0026339197|nr:tetratricopeptide repeat protein [uncultured Aquimarina sp.]
MKNGFFLLLIITVFSCNNTQKKDVKIDVKKYNSLIEKGSLAIKDNKIEEAINNFQEAVSIDPSKTIGYYRLGVIQGVLCNRGDNIYCQKALDNFQKVLDKDSDYEKISYNIGIVHFNQQEYNNALFYFNKAIIKDSTDVDYYINRGFTKLNLKDTLASCLDFKKAYQLGDNEAKTLFLQFCKD